MGPGERVLLPGHVRDGAVGESGRRGDRQGGVGDDDLRAGFQKIDSPGGCREERIINRSLVSSLGMSANPVS